MSYNESARLIYRMPRVDVDTARWVSYTWYNGVDEPSLDELMARN